uniref:Uncharacterized protein n=1 Tax=Arundo donax TaxID=35708 RepID=A0A0A9CKI1_ARUDO
MTSLRVLLIILKKALRCLVKEVLGLIAYPTLTTLFIRLLNLFLIVLVIYLRSSVVLQQMYYWQDFVSLPRTAIQSCCMKPLKVGSFACFMILGCHLESQNGLKIVIGCV